MLDLHRPAQDHTPKQDSIMNFLSANLDKEGGYLMPSAPKGTSFEEMKKLGEKQQGKPWAIIQYHRALSSSMNEIRVPRRVTHLTGNTDLRIYVKALLRNAGGIVDHKRRCERRVLRSEEVDANRLSFERSHVKRF